MFGAYQICVIDMRVLKSLQNFKNLKGTSVLLLAVFTSYCSSKADFMSGRACNFSTFDGIKAAYPAALQFHVVTSPQLEKSLDEELGPCAIHLVSCFTMDSECLMIVLDLGFTLSWNLRNWEIDEAEKKHENICIVSCWPFVSLRMLHTFLPGVKIEVGKMASKENSPCSKQSRQPPVNTGEKRAEPRQVHTNPKVLRKIRSSLARCWFPRLRRKGWDMFILDVYSLWFGESIDLAYLTMLEFNACCMGIKTPVRWELAIRRPWFQEFTPSHGITFESIRNNWIM